MGRVILVGGTCLVLGFGAGWLASTKRQASGATDEADVPAAVAIERAATRDPTDRDTGRDRDQAARLAVAAASLERAAQLPRLQLAPGGPAPSTAPRGDIIVAKEAPVTLDQLPEPLRATVAQIAQGRALRNLTLERRLRNGSPLYETEFVVDGAGHELKLDEAGRILESEVDFAIGELPTQVTGGIASALPGAVLLEAEREQVRNDPAFFEIKIRHQGQLYEVQVAEDGRLLRTSPR